MANGKFGGGNGTSTNPYLIEDADDLNAIRFKSNMCFKMVNDINLADGKYNIGQGWNPINEFSGSFDGNWHKIVNLYINRPTEDNIAFFGICFQCNINHIFFVDANIIGHNSVAVVGDYIGLNNQNHSYNNIYVINSKVKGNTQVAGMFANVDLSCVLQPFQFYNLYYDVNIESNDKVAYGLGKVLLETVGKINNCDCIIYSNGNCICICNGNSDRACTGHCICNCKCNDNRVTMMNNIVGKIHKNSSITTYYGIMDCNNMNYSNCYVDNTEISPIIYGNTQYANLNNVVYSTNILPSLTKNYFLSEPQKPVKPNNLNNDSIYFNFNNGYYVYNFTNRKWDLKYSQFNNKNSIKIIQDGMDRHKLREIPTSALEELKKYGKIKIIDCIYAHDKIVYTTEQFNMNEYTDSTDDSHRYLKKHFSFKDFNDKIINVQKIS